MNQKELVFDGSDYVHERDSVRLTGQLKRIYEQIKDGEWYTLNAIAEGTEDPPASVSAQLRNLRKERFGGHIIEKKHLNNGLYIYRLVKEIK